MEIVINEKTYKVKYGFKALMIYERINDGAPFEGKTLGEILTFFYSCVLAADAEIQFDEFVSWLDENPEAINDFSSYLSSVVEAQTLKKNNWMVNQ